MSLVVCRVGTLRRVNTDKKEHQGALCCVAVDESRSSLAARCVSFYQIVCLSVLTGHCPGGRGDTHLSRLSARTSLRGWLWSARVALSE